METSAAFDGLACGECGAEDPPAAGFGRCSDCGGPLRADYDLDALDASDFDLGDGPGSLWRFADLLPFRADDALTMGEGGTPLVECPTLAGELGVDRVFCKDEGSNPTGSIADRGATVALTAAAATDAADVALASPGNDGHAVAAYAARAGLAAHVYVPTRAGFVQKAMINVHGGDMTVVEGRLREAATACEDTLSDEPDWLPMAPAATPYRLEGGKTLLYELVAALGEAPDAIVVPTGTGVGLAALHAAATELRALGLIERGPRLYAAQAAGCAPIARAVEAAAPVEAWDHPDTICADIEVPEPGAGALARTAIEETGGGAVATEDDAILESAVTMAEHEGLSASPSGGAAASGAWTLAERDAFDPTDTVVLVNPAAGSKTADVLRSHLMGQGV